uniref:Uncharacterized protein n=1 Tax=Chrysotila carterae TaxID=13221 RepID=A0A6S9XL77_CHRCT
MTSFDYSKWDRIGDSDDEEKHPARRAQAGRASFGSRGSHRNGAGITCGPDIAAAAAGANGDTGGLKHGESQLNEAEKAKLLEQYSRMVNPPNAKMKEFKFPKTIEEHEAKCREAESLKKRGNEFYQKGELVEAAKLYEQGVLKFSDWYAESFATDEERAVVRAVKLPCHLNLAVCSMKLGNHTHAITHCSQVLNVEPDNAKALYRRGYCQMQVGNLDEAQADLKRAAQLSPNDAEVRRAMHELVEKVHEYRVKTKQMGVKMVGSSSTKRDQDCSANDCCSNLQPFEEPRLEQQDFKKVGCSADFDAQVEMMKKRLDEHEDHFRRLGNHARSEAGSSAAPAAVSSPSALSTMMRYVWLMLSSPFVVFFRSLRRMFGSTP